MKKTVLILIILTIVSKILGFGRDIILSYFYGTSNISDIYIISLTIPVVLFAVIGKGIYAAFVPLYSRIIHHEGKIKAEYFMNNIVNLVLVCCSLMFFVGIIFTESIVKLFASGFKGETLEMTMNFTRITLVGLFFSGLIYVFSAYLSIKKVFIAPIMIGIPANIIVIGTIFLSSSASVYLMSAGSLIAVISQCLLLFYFSYKYHYRYKLKLDFRDKNLRNMVSIALPAMIGTSVSQINLLIDRTLASQIAVGGITALSYADNLNLAILGIFVLSISTVFYPNISKLAAENAIDPLKKSLSNVMNFVNIVVLPGTVLIMIFSKPIVQLLYGRGEFNSAAIEMTSSALFYYAIGIIGISYREVLTKTFYSLQDTKTPVINATLALILNIILNFMLAPILGIGGLALASSISVTACTLLLFISLRKKIGNLGLKTLSFSFSKIFIISVIMGIISKSVFVSLINQLHPSITLIVSVILGVIVYCVIISFSKVNEIDMVIIEMKEKLKFKRVTKK